MRDTVRGPHPLPPCFLLRTPVFKHDDDGFSDFIQDLLEEGRGSSPGVADRSGQKDRGRGELPSVVDDQLGIRNRDVAPLAVQMLEDPLARLPVRVGEDEDRGESRGGTPIRFHAGGCASPMPAGFDEDKPELRPTAFRFSQDSGSRLNPEPISKGEEKAANLRTRRTIGDPKDLRSGSGQSPSDDGRKIGL
jgi:hypothetical protein